MTILYLAAADIHGVAKKNTPYKNIAERNLSYL